MSTKFELAKYVLLASTTAYAVKIILPGVKTKIDPPESPDCEELWKCLKEGGECSELKEKYQSCWKKER